MPLTDFQTSLAGGAAMLIDPNTRRYSNDLDYFHDSVEGVGEAFTADRELLEARGYALRVGMNQPGYIRAVVRKDEHVTKVERAHDSSWRFMPTVRHEKFGFVLHPIDLAVNKVLALAGRDEPRDLLDTLDMHHNVLCLGALCWAASGKDPGFTPLSLMGMLRRRGRIRPEDLARLRLAEKVDLTELKEQWRTALDSVEPLVCRPRAGRRRGSPFRPARWRTAAHFK